MRQITVEGGTRYPELVQEVAAARAGIWTGDIPDEEFGQGDIDTIVIEEHGALVEKAGDIVGGTGAFVQEHVVVHFPVVAHTAHRAFTTIQHELIRVVDLLVIHRATGEGWSAMQILIAVQHMKLITLVLETTEHELPAAIVDQSHHLVLVHADRRP